jgi:DNA helicase II / ATP-dependent DNA helicase PcrA
MKIIADLHIHSKYSRACSKQLVLPEIDRYCQMKGVDVVATGDFTHPEWFKSMKEELIEKEPGLYVLKENKESKVRFLCSSEISCIYKKGDKVRRLHTCILSPSLEVVEKINKALDKIGNLKSDGRPILGLDGKELARIVFDIDERCVIMPAHIWTPWFAMFGSKSGFDSVSECYEELTDKIFAIETGLSSDPQMNWRVRDLDNISIVSNSDAHSLPNIAREANVFEIDENRLSYDEIVRVIKDKKLNEFLYTIEFYSEEGMYHLDGHRDCGVCFEPKESAWQKNICPKCKKPLVIGVANRVEELADPGRGEDYIDKKRVPFKKLIELDKIIAESIGIKSRSSKKVQEEYMNLIKNFGTEFEILLDIGLDKLKEVTLPNIADGIIRTREGKVHISPGFDGQYGKIKIFEDSERVDYQKKLF